jgi:hypothetical protein
MSSRTVIFIMAICSLFAVTAQATPTIPSNVAFVISVLEGTRVTESDAENFSTLLSNTLPDTRIELIVVSPKKGRSVSAKIADEISARLRPEDIVSQLVIEAHGESSPLLFKSTLKNFGSFSPSGVSTGFAEALAPLRGRMADGAAVMIYACSTLCANEDVAQAQADSVMEYLEISRGSFFGATRPMVPLPEVAALRTNSQQASVEAVKAAKLIATASFFTGVFLSVVTPTANFITGLNLPVIMDFMKLQNLPLAGLKNVFVWSYVGYLKSPLANHSKAIEKRVKRLELDMAKFGSNDGYLIRRSNSRNEKPIELKFSLDTIPRALNARACNAAIDE